MVTDSSVTLDEFVAGLASRHSGAAPRRSTGPDGRHLRRLLEHRLDALSSQIAALPASMHVEFLGLDWLDDNQHIIREAMAQVGGNLPRGYMRSLPAIETEDGAQPRIKELAERLVARAMLPLDLPWIELFLSQYQRNLELTLGELWALPTLLRAVLVDTLCDAVGLGLTLVADAADETERMPVGTTISGCIVSLRMIAAADWRAFVERQSAVERTLAQDPSGHYAGMRPASRNLYRERVERLARRLRTTEPRIAQAAIALCRDAPGSGSDRLRHVGFYLLDRGEAQLVAAVRGRPALLDRLRNTAKFLRAPAYIGVIAGVALLAVSYLLRQLGAEGLHPATRWFTAFCAVVPALTLSAEIVNWLVTQLVTPRVLPKLDFDAGIPGEFATVVAIPCLLGGDSEIDRLLDALEINYLGNDDPALHFVLLSDFLDADREDMPDDAALIRRVKAGVQRLNTRYGSVNHAPFALVHRRRLWNDNAGVWMGWERKRGKIEEFNKWLLGDDHTSISVMHGDADAFRTSAFVITLDADNQLLPGTAAELVGTLAHPLNVPAFDRDTHHIVAGYSVIQPRVDIRPASANRTRYSRLMSGDVGIDLYKSAVSEAYQDLFGQGIYAGKGIYDVRAFARSVGGRIPSNAVLSHDLLEGCLGRAAFASDIIVLENASPNLIAELKRQHRWIRGDWQLLPWLLPGRRASGGRVDLLGWWKLFDNLRRSLLTPTLLALLFLGWVVMPEFSGAITLGVVLVPGLRIVYGLVSDLRRSALRWGTLRSSALRVVRGVADQLGHWALKFLVLPITAAAAADAIVRSVARVTVTRKRLLEWTPSAQSDWETHGAGLARTYRRLIAAPICGAAAMTAAALGTGTATWPAVFGVAWIVAPLAEWLMARERAPEPAMTVEDRRTLRHLARRTWQFYERFVGPETHWLPPDNFQEAPRLALAERTSPTNIGLFIVSVISAHDLGYIGVNDMLTRIDGTTSSIRRMKRFRGHLFNWYSTRDLSVLEPEYVSTVDSGNLLAALLVCRTALAELDGSDLPHVRAPRALTDIVASIDEMLSADATADTAAALATMRTELAAHHRDASALLDTLERIAGTHCAKLDEAVLHIAERPDRPWSAEKIDAVRSWIIQLRFESGRLGHGIVTLLEALGQPNTVRLRDLPACFGDYADALRNRGRPGDEAHAELRELEGLRNRIIARIDRLIRDTDFSFLYDDTRNLFHIGYNNSTGALDGSYYDLLASEARIASLIAIAKGDVPDRHWVHLGRPLRRIGGMRVVLSWSATAFEYLMPTLFMDTPPHGLLDSSCRAVVREHRKSARHARLPWGISESAYYELDESGHYKYYAFGVPSLALRKSTRERYVVTPYASLLALSFDRRAVLENLQRLVDYGCWGRYGLYEALDFGEHATAGSQPRLVQSFMAHHQAMILGALSNALCEDSLIRRFHANPEIAAVEHLLYEALPRRAQDRIIRRMPPVRPRIVPAMTSEHIRIDPARAGRFVNVIGNGHVAVRTSGMGGGDVAIGDVSITRWLPRTDGPGGGDRIYLSSADGGEIRTLGDKAADGDAHADLWCAPHQTELHEQHDGIFARLTVGVAPDNDVVFRRITLTNETGNVRDLTVTSYSELALATGASDRRHPAFNKLFIESEVDRPNRAIVFRRRRRSANEAGLACAFGVVAGGTAEPDCRLIASRRAFFGRDGDRRRPAALRDPDAPLAAPGHPDPAAALSVTMRIEPGATVQVVFVASIAADGQRATELLGHFQSLDRVNFSLEQARRRAIAELTDIATESAEIMRLLEIYADMLWPRPFTASAIPSDRTVPGIRGVLWSRGISGDHPIALMRVGPGGDRAAAEQWLRLQHFLARRGVAIDVVFVDEAPASYEQQSRDRLEGLIDRHRRSHQRGRAFILSEASLSRDERLALEAAAMVSSGHAIDGIREPRADRTTTFRNLPAFVPVRAPAAAAAIAAQGGSDGVPLEFDNGYGGIDVGTGDYVIYRTPTPAPWINVLANADFGTVVSESGSSTTWFQNSSEFRLTSWHNDPVCDRSGEAIYVRDEETGEFWTPTPKPAPAGNAYTVRHAPGLTEFTHESHELSQRLSVFVDSADPVKVSTLRFVNHAPRPRRLTVTYYAEWVFGNHFEDTGPYVFQELDEGQRTLLARNALPRNGRDRTAFLTSTAPLHGITTDRREFLGNGRELAEPVAMKRIGLSGDIIGGAEPCGAYQVHLDLPAGDSCEISFALGAGVDRDHAVALSRAVQDPHAVAERRRATTAYWAELLGSIRVETPNGALNWMVNRWLPYQNLAARLWARTGLYQSAGGFGFRDQLQDSLALLHARPQMTRAQILRACGAQFSEGDVLHWWHETPLRGVRTRCSDDLLWLPFAVSEYLQVTGDDTVLDVDVPFLAGEPLRHGEDERYAEFSVGEKTGSVYEHCMRAVDARVATGANGLPLIGTGDWNDGLNRVGREGRGESAWLGWFLADVQRRMADIAEARGDRERAALLRKRGDELVAALEANAWDGAWYLRAFYDDGSPLGSTENRECRIDLNAQTWPAITGLADRERTVAALDAATDMLVDSRHRLIRLLTPAFDRTLRDPGYIKGYPPGMRENGGQYTHAATWIAWAATCCRRPDDAMHFTDLLNPLLRVTDRAAAERYLGEPYVLAGDVYAVGDTAGQAGWTWYTGSAGWLYRVILERLLGFRPRAGRLRIEPCLPPGWAGYRIDVSAGGARYRIEVRDPSGVAREGAAFVLDGDAVESVDLTDDGATHVVVVTPRQKGSSRHA